MKELMDGNEGIVASKKEASKSGVGAIKRRWRKGGTRGKERRDGSRRREEEKSRKLVCKKKQE